MDLFLSNKEHEDVLNLFPVLNRFSVLSQESEEGCVGQEKEIISPVVNSEKLDSTNLGNKTVEFDLLARQTALVSETIINLYTKLDKININIEKLQTMIASLADKSTLREPYSLHSPNELAGKALLQNSHKPSGARKTSAVKVPSISKEGISFTKLRPASNRPATPHSPVLQANKSETSNYCLQLEKVALLVGNLKINVGRWDNRKAVEWSLRQILDYYNADLGIVNILWLPSKDLLKRLVITFSSPFIPSLLFNRRIALRKFQILPTRVFADKKCHPLCKLRDYQILTRGPSKTLVLGRKIKRKVSNSMHSSNGFSNGFPSRKDPIALPQDHMQKKSQLSSSQEEPVQQISKGAVPTVIESALLQTELDMNLSCRTLEARSTSFSSMPSLESTFCLLAGMSVRNPELSQVNEGEGVIQDTSAGASGRTQKEKLGTVAILPYPLASQEDCDLDSRVIHSIYLPQKPSKKHQAKSLAVELEEAEARNQDLDFRSSETKQDFTFNPIQGVPTTSAQAALQPLDPLGNGVTELSMDTSPYPLLNVHPIADLSNPIFSGPSE